jgi:hypothetical protein
MYKTAPREVYYHRDTEDTEKGTAESRIFSVLSVQEKKLRGGHREGTPFRRETNLRVLRASVLIKCENAKMRK